jgi:hypothetical protein
VQATFVALDLLGKVATVASLPQDLDDADKFSQFFWMQLPAADRSPVLDK